MHHQRREPPGRQHVLTATKTCKLCGLPPHVITAQQPGTTCDGGAALRRKVTDAALLRACARR